MNGHVAELRHPPQADGYQQCKTLRVSSLSEASILIDAFQRHAHECLIITSNFVKMHLIFTVAETDYAKREVLR